MENIKLCKDCGLLPPSHSVRCLPCFRKFRALSNARRREKLQIKRAELGKEDDYILCSKCNRYKPRSSYFIKNVDPANRIKKYCDVCVTANMQSKHGTRDGFSTLYWKQRAYTCNTAGRQTLAKMLGVKVPAVKTEQLTYICKPQDLAEIFSKQEGKCFYCTTQLEPWHTSVDHAEALSRGGKHSKDNFRLTCRDCNHLKGTRNEQEFKAFVLNYARRFS